MMLVSRLSLGNEAISVAPLNFKCAKKNTLLIFLYGRTAIFNNNCQFARLMSLPVDKDEAAAQKVWHIEEDSQFPGKIGNFVIDHLYSRFLSYLLISFFNK